MTSETLEKWPKSISFFNLSINSFIYHWIGHFIILLTWLFLYFYVFGYLYDGFVLFFYNWDRLTSIQSSRKITSGWFFLRMLTACWLGSLGWRVR